MMPQDEREKRWFAGMGFERIVMNALVAHPAVDIITYTGDIKHGWSDITAIMKSGIRIAIDGKVGNPDSGNFSMGAHLPTWYDSEENLTHVGASKAFIITGLINDMRMVACTELLDRDKYPERPGYQGRPFIAVEWHIWPLMYNVLASL